MLNTVNSVIHFRNVEAVLSAYQLRGAARLEALIVPTNRRETRSLRCELNQLRSVITEGRRLSMCFADVVFFFSDQFENVKNKAFQASGQKYPIIRGICCA